MQTVIRHRKPLSIFKEKLQSGNVTLGFLGGSITDAAPGHNWPEAVVAWLVDAYSDVRFKVENAGIGATGSDLAVFRAKRDIQDRGCDLVFVEYAVNDYFEANSKRARSREGLIRRLLSEGIEVVLVYTYLQEMYEDMAAGRVPDSIAEFERIAEHYGIGSVWMGLHAFDEVRRGFMKWEEWLPDGLHPTQRGSLSYAQSVIRYLEKELSIEVSKSSGSSPLPAPLEPLAWETVERLSFDEVQGSGPWTIRRSSNSCWIDQLLTTSAVGAKLEFAFTGRGLAMAFDFGKTSSEFRYRVDGGEWQLSGRDRPNWCPDRGWYRLFLIADELPDGPHRCEVEVVHGNREGCTGTRFDLAFIGEIR